MTLEPGLRVVRGPDWEWQDQDGGYGHVGTVISFGRTVPDSPLNTVNVRWDRGLRGDYRMGFRDAYDLRMFDNGSVGDCHSEFSCDDCHARPIPGIRWQCKNMPNYNLCSDCYHGGRTNLDYQFYRIIIPGAKWDLMPKRSNSQQIEIKGLFPGAKVIKGSDLELGDADERKYYMGNLFSLCEWVTGNHNTGAVVDWPPLGRDTYRVGYRGKVDLKTKNPGSGGCCYIKHLPVLGEPIEMQSVNGLKVGDHVTIVLERDLLQDLQEGHGDWVPGMVEDIGHVGVIRDITVRKDVVVEYPQRRRKWIFHQAALSKMEKFKVGDSVSITADLINALKIQTRHAMSGKQLQKSIGKLATVMEVDESGSYRIQLDENGQDLSWVNPVVLKTPVIEATPCSSNVPKLKDVTERIGLDVMLNVSDKLAIEAAQGNTEAVQRLIRLHPDWVNKGCDNKTALQLASHGGFMDVIQALLNSGAEIDMRDQDGDTALMYAIYGNNPVVVDYLILRGADVNIVNKEHRSSLHQAVTRGFVECVKVLLKDSNCKVNTQDNFGDTALHDAISGESLEIMSLLFASQDVDFKLTNKRQFNALQWAALKGNLHAINKMIAKDPELANIPTREGLSPLHIAAMNNFPDICRILVVKGHCDVDAYSNGQQTPLFLAVSAGHVEVIEVLLTLGADVNATDTDGDTSLHVALLRQVIFPEVTSTIAIQKIQARIQDKTIATSGLALACLLVENKANLSHMNNKGKTCFDIVPDRKIHVVLRHFVPQNGSTRSDDLQRNMRRREDESVLQSSLSSDDEDRPMPEYLRMQQVKFRSLRPQGADTTQPKQTAHTMRSPKPVTEEIKRQDENVLFTYPMDGLPRQQDMSDHHEDIVCEAACEGGLLTGHLVKEESLLLGEGSLWQPNTSDKSEHEPPGGNILSSVAQEEVRKRGDLPENKSKETIFLSSRQQVHVKEVQSSPFHTPHSSAGGDASSPIHKQSPPRSDQEHISRQQAKEAQFSPLNSQPNTPSVAAGGSGTGGASGVCGGGGDDATSPHHALSLRLLMPTRNQGGVTAGQDPHGVSQTPLPMSLATATPTTTLPPNLTLCRMGCGRIADGQFMPCQHIIVCHQCSECFKLCHECKVIVESVVQLSRPRDIITNTDPAMGQQASMLLGASGVSKSSVNQDSDSELTKSVLIQKNKKLAEELECGICLSQRKEFVFICGHSLCHNCIDAVEECPFCRTPIQKKIKMY